MEEKSILLFFHSINHFNEYNVINNNFFKDSSNKIIALTLELRFFLERQNISFKSQEEYISQIQASEMDKRAFEISEKWHKNLDQFQKISLGLLTELRLKFYFSRIIRNIQTILNIIEIEEPIKIITFEDNDIYIKDYNNTLKNICFLKNIELTIISNRTFSKFHESKTKQKKLYQLSSKFSNILNRIKFSILEIIMKFLWKLKKLKMDYLQKKTKKILNFNFGYHNSVIEQASKLYNILTFQGNIYKIKFILENIKNIFLSKRYPYNIFFKPFDSTKIQKDTEIYFNNLFKNWKMLILQPNFKENFTYKDISLWPIVKSKIFQTVFSFRNLIKNLLMIKEILNEIKCNLIIFSFDFWEEPMACSIIAANMKIPTLTIQHGAWGRFPGSMPSFSQKHAVWGEICRKIFNELGISYERTVISGCPRFDIYIYLKHNKNQSNKIKKSVYKDFNIKNDKKLIIFATNNVDPNIGMTSLHLNLTEMQKSLESILNTINKFSNSHLIIKLRSEEKIDNIILDNIKNLGIENVSITKDYNIVNLITACNCFITGESTTAFEAMIAEKPVICLDFKRIEYYLPFFKYNTAYRASNSEELYNMIKKSFNDPIPLENYKKLLKDYLYKLDGLSTKRVLSIIDNLINKM